MFLRFLFLFGGIVLMISGCNGLVSGQFGTHKLRTVSLSEAVAGLGDADFVEVTDAELAAARIVGPALRENDADYVLQPILSAEQLNALADGQTVTAHLIAWWEAAAGNCPPGASCPPPAGPVRGLLSPPTDKKNPVADWADQHIRLGEPVTYLQLGERPLAWHWNLLLFVGGIATALGAEALNHRRNAHKTE